MNLSRLENLSLFIIARIDMSSSITLSRQSTCSLTAGLLVPLLVPFPGLAIVTNRPRHLTESVLLSCIAEKYLIISLYVPLNVIG